MDCLTKFVSPQLKTIHSGKVRDSIRIDDNTRMIVVTDRISAFNKKIKTKVDKQTLVDNGLAKKKDLVKILGRGELTAKLDITIHSFSKSAKAAIEKAGGTATVSEK